MMCSSFPHNPSRCSGFSLVEIAVGLVIISLVIGSFVTPISTLRENVKRSDTEKMLDDIHDALIGFAMNNAGRLPCPATLTSNGLESQSGTACVQEHGFVPGVSLGLQGAYGNNNLLEDSWGNPYRYSFSSTASYQICIQSGCPGAATILSSSISALIISTGKDGASTTTSPDQVENIDGDNIFVKHEPREGATTAFDDHIRWVSPNAFRFYLSR